MKDAYEKLSSKWESGAEVPSAAEFLKIRYSFELLSNPIWKRNYDIYGVEEQSDVIDKVKRQYTGISYSEIVIPLLEVTSSDPGDNALNVLTSADYKHMFDSNRTYLIQLYSIGSRSSAEFSDNWKRIVSLLDDVANTGMVELGEVQLATYLAQKRSRGRPFLSNGIPSLVAFPPGCRTSQCLVRYDGELSVDAITDWFSTNILSLPRILYYSKESLGQKFIAKTGPSKVKVIFFSRTGQRATPFVRALASNYQVYVSFAFVLWREEEHLIWWNALKVDSAPAIVILRDPGVEPVVHHGSFNSSWLSNIMEQNKLHELPQLRSVTSLDLGCDARGYSRAGNDAIIWYCVILAGRQSQELDDLRKTMRRVQESLSTYGDERNKTNKDQAMEPSAIVLKEKRLTFTWLDGESQKDYCFFYLDGPNSYEACGPRKYPVEVPQLFIVRYKRNTSLENIAVEKNPKNIANVFQKDVDRAAQLVAKYNGTHEVQQIIQWVSQIVEDGDTKNLPFYRTKTPDLIPEDADPIWSQGARKFISTGKGVKQRILESISEVYVALGPILLLGAVISLSSIWLRRTSSVPVQSSPSSQPPTEDGDRQRRQNHRRSDYQPPSITDNEPKDAYQMPLSDSESE